MKPLATATMQDIKMHLPRVLAKAKRSLGVVLFKRGQPVAFLQAIRDMDDPTKFLSSRGPMRLLAKPRVRKFR